MRTFTGVWIDASQGVPTIKDIAVMQGRMCRYNGACQIYWPVLTHSLAVSQLVKPKNKVHALLHDAAEVVTSDIPRTMKTDENKELEMRILLRIYDSLGIPFPNDENWADVMEADNRILAAECRLFGPPNILGTEGWTWLGKEDKEANDVLMNILNNFNIEQVISKKGKYVKLFEEELENEIKKLKEGKSAVAIR